MDVNTAYILFKLKGWKPSDYYHMDYGERLVTRAFLHQEDKELKKEMEEMRKG